MKRNNQDRRAATHTEPIDVLSGLVNSRVFIRLIDKTEVIGELLDFDEYLNLKIELQDEQLLIRGNNVILVGSEWENLTRGE